MRLSISILPVVLVLAACSAEPAQETDTTSPDPVASEETAPETLEVMPEAFLGSWDFALEDCGSGISEMQLTISASEVEFYESGAQLTNITQTAPNTVTAIHAFSGEGEEWEETLAYEVNEDGDRLTVTTPEGSMSIRQRCP